MKNVLIIGGTSGLGLEMAVKFFEEGHRVVVTGRRLLHDGIFSLSAPAESHKTIRVENLNLEYNTDSIGRIVFTNFREEGVDILVYAAGFYQKGTIGELSGIAIEDMLFVGLRAPAFILRHILLHQEKLSGFIAISSTSQWTPKPEEPMYTAVKAGLYMLANSVSLDERIGKVLVVAPAGIKTDFFKGHKTKEEMKDYLDPKWVADQIIGLYSNSLDPDGAHYEFRFAKILRNPPRVVVEETRYLNK